MKDRKLLRSIRKIFFFFISFSLLVSGNLSVRAEEEIKTENKIEDESVILEEEPIILIDEEEEPDFPEEEKPKKTEKEEKTEENGWSKHKLGKTVYYKYKKPGHDKFAVGRVKIGKNYYYFDQNGYLQTNKWIKQKNTKVYYTDKNGILAKGWKRISNYYYYFDNSNRLVQDLIKEFGESWYEKQKLYIKVNKYHNCVTIYGRSGDKEYNMPIRTFPCTAGYATPLLSTRLNKGNTYRWHELMGPTYGQFCTRIHGGVLFHSVIYRRPNKHALITRQYNKLGMTASHGCVRLAVIDAKRIYDDVKRLGSIGITIYSDSKSEGPFDKPSYPKVNWNQTFDPTDPTIK